MPADGPWGWAGPLLVTAFAGFLRFWQLGTPRGYIFDEVYYAKDAWSLWRHGVELDATGTGPAFVVHPPLGKWLIAVGEGLFGNTEVGWRVAGAMAGTLSVLVLARAARRLTRSTLLGFAWDVGARRTAGVRRPFTAALHRDLPPLAGALAALPAAVYLLAWSGWFATSNGWDRHWA